MNRLAIVLAALLVLFSMATGCASGGQAKESTTAVESLDDMIGNIDKAKAEVAKSISSLDALSSGQNLEKNFKTYTSSVDAIESAGEKAKKRWDDMKKRGDAYVAKWQAEAAEVKDPAVKAGMEERRAKVKANFTRIHDSAAGVADAYRPYLKDLQDIEKALSLDLTPAGVNSIQGPISTGKANGRTLVSKLDALKAELTDVLGGMTPTGKP